MSTDSMTTPLDPKAALDSFEIWFLTGSQGLYGPGTLAQVEQQSREVHAQLAAALPVKLIWKPVLTDADGIRRALIEASADDHVIGVTTWMHTFSPAKMWIGGLKALTKPLLHLHTQANVTLPWAELDFDFMNLNQAAHGDREFGYLLARMGVAHASVVGHVGDPRVQARVQSWSRAAAANAAIRDLRLTRFGDNMRYVAVTEGDKTEAEIELGVQVNTWPVNELANAVATAEQDTAAVDALVAEYDASYELVPELRADGARRQSLRDGAAIELGLRALLEANRSAAFTTNFEDLGALKQLPGLAVQRLMADGYGFGAEGDWKTAILVRAMNVAGAGLAGGASLMEDYTYDLTQGHELILGAHMLEVSPTLTAGPVNLEIHPLGIGGKDDPVRLVFSADPGEAVVVALSDTRDGFRLTANVVDVVPPTQALPKLPVGRAVWAPRPSFAVSAECWLTAGAAHHTVMTKAVGLQVVQDLATMVGTEFVVIDEGTTVRSFTDELRLQQVWHRADRGF